MKLLLLPVAVVVVLVRYATVLVLALVIVLYLLFWPLINSLRHRRQPEKCRKGSTFVACCTCSNESCPNSARLGSGLIEQLVKWPLTVNVLSIGVPTNVFPSIHKSIFRVQLSHGRTIRQRSFISWYICDFSLGSLDGDDDRPPVEFLTSSLELPSPIYHFQATSSFLIDPPLSATATSH